MVLNKNNIKNEIKIVSDELKKNKENYSVSFYFEYTENGKSQINQFRYAQAKTDKGTEKSMLERLVKTFSDQVIDNYDLSKFDILQNKKSTIYYMDQKNKLFKYAKKVISKLNDPTFTPEEDLTVLGKMTKVKGAIVELNISKNNKKEKFYLFLKLEKFNPFKKRNWKDGFMATIDKDGVKRITDNDTYFGVKDKISFYYYNNHFIINSNNDFERMLFLAQAYTINAKNTANFLLNYQYVFPNINNLVNNVSNGKGSSILARMMTKISIKDIKTRFSKTNIDKTLKTLNDIVEDQQFKSNFNKIKVDVKNKKIEYTDNNKFEFVSLLSDRPSKTLFLGRKFIE